MKSAILAGIFLITSTVAFAQQPAPSTQADPVILQRALTVLQSQRNQAMDAAAAADIRSAGLVDDLAKANARIKELEPAKESPKN